MNLVSAPSFVYRPSCLVGSVSLFVPLQSSLFRTISSLYSSPRPFHLRSLMLSFQPALHFYFHSNDTSTDVADLPSHLGEKGRQWTSCKKANGMVDKDLCEDIDVVMACKG